MEKITKHHSKRNTNEVISQLMRDFSRLDYWAWGADINGGRHDQKPDSRWPNGL
ncbi:hypothetical protein L195_g054815 [Trifolium pratense]|uniref:Uncharacterized protein n=1 Tax=Trifolium pratense TaxID=57577 RepID=A0A2K3KI81_TRIPR|nr:hypothetical protein L195_g054815 [Trifolium pratense]